MFAIAMQMLKYLGPFLSIIVSPTSISSNLCLSSVLSIYLNTLLLNTLLQEEERSYLEKAERLNSLMNAVTDKVMAVYTHTYTYIHKCKHTYILVIIFVFQSVFRDGENTKVRVAELEEEVQTLKKINKDLYDFSRELLAKPT